MNIPPTTNKKECLQIGSLGYAWVPLPKPIDREGELFPYAVLPIKVGCKMQLIPCGPGVPCRTEDEAQKLLEHFMVNRPNVARFKIYCEGLADRQQRKEASELQELLWNLESCLKLDEISFGQPPQEPDFIFQIQGKEVGVELTKLNPKTFNNGGFAERDIFKKWKAETKPTAMPQKFPWGCYTLRESLSALQVQIDGKCGKAMRQRSFPERWLLLHVAKGSPFSQILGGKHKTAPGREEEVADFLAKSMHGAFSICREAKPFDYVIFFMQDDFIAFPTGLSNPRNLPVPSKEILARGAQASDRFLDWQKDSSSVTQAA